MYWLTVAYCGHSHPHWCMISSLVLECWQPRAHRFMEDGADAACPTEGTVEKKAWAYIPSGSYFLCMRRRLYDVVLSVHLWAESCSQLWVWCEVTSAWLWGGGVHWNPSFLLLLLFVEKIKTILCRGLAVKTRMKTLPHEAVVINWGERKAVVCGTVWAPPRQLECGSFFNAKIFPNTMTWLCPLAEGGRGEGVGET